ncbi:MAG TPA: DUF411 domain-containing protein [Gemmatimonadaceae bacterium]|nr:DUF411 domain-containing protein [Gemmatimonadaceae bacterium]
MLSRREWIRLSLGGAAVALAAPAVASALVDRAADTSPDAAAPLDIVVYKSPSCGCCKKWEEHLRANGFKVTERSLDDLSEVKATFGVPAAVMSCHTGTIGGYVVEGHVPADLIKRMLKERPKAAGIAVPGMPVGSPGMEQGKPQRYDVVLFDKSSRTRVYASR